MRKLTIHFFLFFFLGSNFLFSQVGINTTTPEGVLDVVSTDSGLVIPRVANVASVTSPVNGMIIYDLSSSCVKGYNNGAWSNCFGAASTSVTNDCDTNGFSGNYYDGEPFTASNTFSVTIENESFSTATIAFATTDVVLSGTAAAGLTVSGVSPASATLISGQTALVTYTLSGTPSSSGTLTADWSKLSLYCQRSINIDKGFAVFSQPDTYNVFSMYDAGPPLYDVQGVIDNGANQVTFNVPYTGGLGNYDAYSSSPITLIGEGGDTNDIIITYPAGNFSASGTIPVTIFVDGDGSFNVLKQSLGSLSTISSLDFIYNGVDAGVDLIMEAIGGLLPNESFTYTHANPPNASYPDNGGIELNDDLTPDWSMGWIAGQTPADTPDVRVDYTLPTLVDEVRIHFYGGGGAGVYAPRTVTISGSNDGTNYTVITSENFYPLDDTTGFKTLSFPSTVAYRYYRVEATRNSAAQQWIMMNEIDFYFAGQQW